MLLAQRWILARLRHQRFFGLDEINRAIQPLLAELNHRPFKRLPGSRQSAFETVDRPALKPLPPTRYEFAEWKRAVVGIDYHVELERHYYSVPYRYARQPVDVRSTAATVEIFLRGERLASHPRCRLPGRHTTVAVHLAPAHRAVAGWNAPRFLEWAARIGPHTQTTIERVLQARAHPQQGYRTALGILRLAKLRQRAPGSRLPAHHPAPGPDLPQYRLDPQARPGSPDHRARLSRFAPPARQRARPFLLLLRKPPCSIVLRANVWPNSGCSAWCTP